MGNVLAVKFRCWNTCCLLLSWCRGIYLCTCWFTGTIGERDVYLFGVIHSKLDTEQMMHPPMNRLIIYTKKVDEMIDFYTRYFGFQVQRQDDDRIVELTPSAGGAALLLHPAGKAQKEGQVLIKLVFDVEDVQRFRVEAEAKGLKFGAVHKANGYVFANCKDPSKNSVSISSRAFAALT